MTPSDATVLDMATTAGTNIGTIAVADQLNQLRKRVPLSEGDIARATGADEATVSDWIERKAAPTGERANRLNELLAVVEEMARNIKAEAIPEWLTSEVPALNDGVPADVIANGGYEQVMSLAVGLSAGVFT